MWNSHCVQAYPFTNAEIALHKMFAAQKIFTSILAESILHNWPTFSAHSLHWKKMLHYKCSHNYNIFSQEVWVQVLMALE
jgi:hypothetical protein